MSGFVSGLRTLARLARSRPARGGLPARAPARRTAAAAAALIVMAGCGGADDGDRDAPERGATPTASPERDAVLAAAQAVLDALNEANPTLLRRIVKADAPIVRVAPGEAPTRSTVERMAGMLADPPGALFERMWSPLVEVHGPLASVWAPFDFYLDGELSHCGINAFHLVEEEGAWRVQALTYSHLRPPACETHPDGPPAGAGSTPGNAGAGAPRGGSGDGRPSPEGERT